MAYYPQGLPQDFSESYLPYPGQHPHQHQHHHHQRYPPQPPQPHQHQHNHPHQHQQHRYPPGYGYYDPQFAYPGHPYYGYPPQYQTEGYAQGYYAQPGQYPGAPQQPQQPRAVDTRKGLNIVDPREKEQRLKEANGSAPAQSPPAHKNSALPIKDPHTRQPINIVQPHAAAATADGEQPPAESSKPVAAAQQTSLPVTKKKAIPILDPHTRKEVTAKNSSSTSSPSATQAAPEAGEPPLPSSSSATPAPSTPRSVGNSEDAAVASQSSEETKVETPTVAAPAVATSSETLVFAPGTTWGAPQLPRPAESFASVSNSSTLAMGSSSQSDSSRTRRRVYDFEFLLSLSSKAPPPPENLKTYEVYSPDARVKRLSENNAEHKVDKRDRRAFGNKTVPTYSKVPQGPFEGDMRSKMGTTVAAPVLGAKVLTFESLTNRADTAFNMKNSRNTTTEAHTLKKIRGILNKITPEKYLSLFEDLWTELHIDGQMEITDTVENVIRTVFDIALDQPKFSYLYAEICHGLCRRIQTLKDSAEGVTRCDSNASEDSAKPSATLKEFRRFLLNTCQARFEEGSKHQQTVLPPDAPPEEREVIEKAEQRYKARSLGNIKFIAELFKRSLLSERIMHIVIKILLLDTDHSDARNIESLETLNEMLKEVGKKLDTAMAKGSMDLYFNKLGELSETHPVKRIRFLVMNMIELRNNNWVKREDLKQQDDGRRPSAARTPSWAGEAPRPARTPGITREPSYKEKERERERERVQDRDGFQIVGRPKSGATDRSNFSMRTPSPVSPAPAKPKPAPAPAPAPVTPSIPVTPPRPEPRTPSLEAECPTVPHLPDDKIAAKARGLLEEWTNDPSNLENAVLVLREEIPRNSYSKFLMGMLLFAISHNKRDREREQLPALCGLYAQEGLLLPTDVEAAFVGALQKARRDELWVDVPCLWKNVGGLLCACLQQRVLLFEVLTPLFAVVEPTEECPDLPTDFLAGVADAMRQEDMTELFEPGPATAVVRALAQKKGARAPHVASLAEFEAALHEVLTC